MSRTKKVVDAVALTVTFSYVDGGMRVYDANELSEEMRNRLIVHGLAQKLGDSYAGRDGHEDCTEAVWSNLMEGNWGAERGSCMEDKLEAAEDRVAEYDNMTDDEKRAVAKLGVSRLALVKEVEKLKKQIAKRDEKK